ncbi:hypothetical protein H0H92_014111 [Tricholoma furcatifolium]|nr:hypothetical protein H0H92_014111 [Tricholoma furcatifolium]
MAGITAAQAISMAADDVYLKKRPPPISPTGYYDWQITIDPQDSREGHSIVTNLISEAETVKAKGVYVPKPRDVDAFLNAVEYPTAIDDRKGAFATGLGILARLDPKSDLEHKLNDSVVGTLYNTVPHPPATFVGPQYCYRQADGGGNNLLNPEYGRAGTAYARSVQGKAGLPYSSLPEAGLIFDSILQRKGTVNHPGGMSSLIFAFAAIVTHSLFRTDKTNMYINNASSYFDLSPLYGDNQAAQDKVRDKASGRGLIFPDTFSEERLIFLPPATSVLLVLFSRNHNYIADKLLKINERRLWSDPPPTDPVKRALQDEQIFQTARLVNGGYFMSAIMGDYVAGFLGSSEGLNWNMNAFDIINTKDLKVDRGLGNHCSVEFNVLYRWHATLSVRDQEWTEGVFNSAFGGKPFNQLNLSDLATIAQISNDVAPNPAQRTFAGLKRSSSGEFSDDDLAQILYNAIEAPAGAFRGRGTPEVLRLIEIMGIEQSRAWGVCTMNEFRKFLGLKQFQSFEEWNPDPEIAVRDQDFHIVIRLIWIQNAARQLYGHIDNLELYTGLQAESTMPLTDGSHFACGVTFLAFDTPETRFALENAAVVAGTNIGALTAKSIIEVIPSSSPTILGKISSAATSLFWSPKGKEWYPFLSRLAATGRPIDELLGNVMSVAVAASWAHGAVNVIDFYLDDERAKERQQIIQLVNNKGPGSEELLRGYVSEGMRLRPQYTGLWRKAEVDAVIDQGPALPPMEIKAGDWIRGSFKNAHLNPLDFPDPLTVNPKRPASAYSNLNGTGFHICPGVSFSVLTITEIVKVVFGLKNVRRAPGSAGTLRRFTEIVHETASDVFIQRNGTIGSWPGSMNILYDD